MTTTVVGQSQHVISINKLLPVAINKLAIKKVSGIEVGKKFYQQFTWEVCYILVGKICLFLTWLSVIEPRRAKTFL